jgi:hypothetical protein
MSWILEVNASTLLALKPKPFADAIVAAANKITDALVYELICMYQVAFQISRESVETMLLE